MSGVRFRAGAKRRTERQHPQAGEDAAGKDMVPTAWGRKLVLEALAEVRDQTDTMYALITFGKSTPVQKNVN